jgi:hypothetical protein
MFPLYCNLLSLTYLLLSRRKGRRGKQKNERRNFQSRREEECYATPKFRSLRRKLSKTFHFKNGKRPGLLQLGRGMIKAGAIRWKEVHLFTNNSPLVRERFQRGRLNS